MESAKTATKRKKRAQGVSIGVAHKGHVERHDPFDAVSHPLRRELLEVIGDSGSTGIVFSDIWSLYHNIINEATGKPEYTKPNISQHLGRMADAGIITVRREGNFKRFFANPEVLRGIKKYVDKVTD